MAKIVLAGGTGNLGRLLIAHFLQNGDELTILSRDKDVQIHPQVLVVYWDGRNLGTWREALQGIDVLINLCGKSVQCLFSNKNKKSLYDSRLIPTRLLAQAILSLEDPPKLWINFSGVSIFTGLPGLHDETSTSVGSGFLAHLSQAWESAFLESELPSTRKVILRISPVLSMSFGIINKLFELTKFGLAGRVGDGKQLVSWIHQADFVHLVRWLINQSSPKPVYHACSPNPVSNAEFMKALRLATNSLLGLPLPEWMAYLGGYIKGVDPSLMIESVPVTTILTLQNGYPFIFPYIQPSIKDLLKTSI